MNRLFLTKLAIEGGIFGVALAAIYSCIRFVDVDLTSLDFTHADADGAMSHVFASSILGGVVVQVLFARAPQLVTLPRTLLIAIAFVPTAALSYSAYSLVFATFVSISEGKILNAILGLIPLAFMILFFAAAVAWEYLKQSWALVLLGTLVFRYLLLPFLRTFLDEKLAHKLESDQDKTNAA